jgi:hypothetical protein
MLSTLALQWLPVVAGATILAVLGDAAISGMPLRTWSVVTCIVLGIHCAGIRGWRILPALPLIAVPVLLFVLSLVVIAQDWPIRNSFTWNLALVCCWLVTAALVARTWQIVRPSFQLAPVKPSPTAAEPIRAEGIRTRAVPWKPVLSTIFPAMGFGYLYLFVAMGVLYSPFLVFFVIFSSQDWVTTRSRFRWLLALPVPPRTMLLAGTLPGMLSLICGYLVGVHLSFIPGRAHGVGLRTQIVTVVFIAGYSMLANLSALAGHWYRLRHALLPGHWNTIFMLSFLVGGMVLIFFQILERFDPAGWLSATLPESLGRAIGLSVLLLAALWWALDAMFREVEFADKPVTGDFK